MYEVLKGMRIVEGASFVAAPLCGLTLVQLGADVIRFDPIGGGPDYGRWPLSPNGASYYWEGLNKGKRSIAINLSTDAGRELAVELATAKGENSGYFVTNYPAQSFLSHERLTARRADMISVRVTGSNDGQNAVDYTINCATGYPFMTGSPRDPEPVNHVLPTWDIATGLTSAVSLLAADRDRRLTGKGREIRVPLSDVAFGTLATLGHVAEVQGSGLDRPRYGNSVFGTFGRDFETRDPRRIMIVAVTVRQWVALVKALAIETEISAIERSNKVDFAAEEGARFVHRDAIFRVIEARVGSYRLDEVADLFSRVGVCWGIYRTIREALLEDPRLSGENPLFETRQHPSGIPYLTPGFPAQFVSEARRSSPTAPFLGAHTDEILADIVGLSAAKIGELHDAGIVAGPE